VYSPESDRARFADCRGSRCFDAVGCGGSAAAYDRQISNREDPMTYRKALVVIDVQRVYMEPEPMLTADGDDLIPKCRGLLDRARDAAIPVLFVQHRSDDQPDDPDLVGIHPDLGLRPDEPVVEKRFGSAFFKTDLEPRLREAGIEELVLCGLATFGCVNATVMCAICKGYEVTVVRDAHGSTDFPDTPAAQMVEVFNRTWEAAGARLLPAASVEF
jgi:nicotinamidase-related amidase